jgi:hypothetical protein
LLDDEPFLSRSDWSSLPAVATAPVSLVSCCFAKARLISANAFASLFFSYFMVSSFVWHITGLMGKCSACGCPSVSNFSKKTPEV